MATKKARARHGERLWPRPHLPDDESVREISHQAGFATNQVPALREFLIDLVAMTDEQLADLRGPRQISGFRKDVERLSKQLHKAAIALRVYAPKNFVSGSRFVTKVPSRGTWSFLPPPGFKEFGSVLALRLSPLFTPQFLKRAGHAARADGHARASSYDPARAWVEQVIEHQPLEVLEDTLLFVESALQRTATTLRANTKKGGANRPVVGPWLLMNLAAAYARFAPGQDPTSNRHGRFFAFASSTVAAMGLPGTWIDRQIKQGLADWQARAKPSKKSMGFWTSVRRRK